MKQHSGFTLIELSVVLAIIGVILYGSMSILVVGVQTSQVNSTVATMDAIEKALLNFRVAFGRIPCPTDLTTTATSANYGIEAANIGSCTGGSPAANFIAASGTAEGGVPTRALRLPDSYMYDGWGHKFRYTVNPNYTITSSASCTLSTTPAITINDASGAARSTQAIYAIVSHGANGHGAYTSNGLVVNAKSTNADEQTNCHCDNTAAHTGGAGVLSPVTYVQKAPTIATAGSPLTAFDDIVAYKEFWQLMTPNLTSNALGCLFTGYYRTITIDHTKVGAVNNTDQSSFPVLFSGTYSYLATVANGGLVTNSNGYDITFTSDAAGTHLLPFERESYNATTGVVNFWVQVPTVSHSADTVIYLQYGNPNITTNQSNANGVWDSNYLSVQHLGETSGTSAPDSTSNANNGTKVSSSSPNPTSSGKIDGAESFNGSSDYITEHNGYSNFTNGLTLEIWAYPTAANGWQRFFDIGNGQAAENVLFYRINGTTNLGFETYIDTIGSGGIITATGAIALNQWQHFVITEDASRNIIIYKNGSSVQTGTESHLPDNLTRSSNFLGRSNWGDPLYQGTMDEARVSNIARSADWINTEYNNQNQPDKATYGSSGFYTVGTQTGR